MKGIYLLGLVIILIGFNNEILLVVGILTFLLGLILFLTESIKAYIVIYSLWLIGGVIAFINSHNLINILASGFTTFFGLAYLILSYIKQK